MRRPFHPHSRSFRAVLSMALLAWAMLASGALASPLRMFDAMGVNAAIQAAQPQSTTVHCDSMAMVPGSHTSTPAPMPPVGNGHGCCHNGGCYCASVCSGIVGVPAFRMTWPPVHDIALSLIHSEPVLAHSAPPLRPPIA
ncbi:MAG TPA: hypothetical protein VJ722_10420 [Rhodanobacteraceae bacterium]|nr:hypothetical protein [Rhodanobacteraceae bacterium]